MNSTRSRSRCTRKGRAEPGEGMAFIPLFLFRRDDGKASTLDDLRSAVCVRACGDRDRCYVATEGLQTVSVACGGNAVPLLHTSTSECKRSRQTYHTGCLGCVCPASRSKLGALFPLPLLSVSCARCTNRSICTLRIQPPTLTVVVI